MATTVLQQVTFQKDSISNVLKTFLEVKKIEKKSPNTILFYKRECGYFINWLIKIPIEFMDQLTPKLIREYLDDLSTHRNAGGVHAGYRSIKAMLYFYDFEFEPDWKNPIKKVKLPPVKINPLPGIPKNDVEKLIKICSTGRNGIRDRAIISCLSSSGCRASEFLNLNVEDINLISGKVKIIHGKGDKYRITFINRDSRRFLRKYLSSRPELEPTSPIWLNEKKRRLTVSGLRNLVLKHTRAENMKPYKLHDFRRFFALNLYRNHVGVFDISLLLGHSSVEITKKYLNIDEEDLKQAYLRGNPFD